MLAEVHDTPVNTRHVTLDTLVLPDGFMSRTIIPTSDHHSSCSLWILTTESTRSLRLPPPSARYARSLALSTAVMASMWSSMTYVLLPPALILLLLLTIPFPGRFVNRMIVKTGDFVFSIKIGTLSIFSVITTISFIVLLAQSFDLQKRHAQKDAMTVETHMHYSADLQKKATRWRSERNWWISALTFIIYWMLLRFHAVKKQLLRAQRHED